MVSQHFTSVIWSTQIWLYLVGGIMNLIYCRLSSINHESLLDFELLKKYFMSIEVLRKKDHFINKKILHNSVTGMFELFSISVWYLARDRKYSSYWIKDFSQPAGSFDFSSVLLECNTDRNTDRNRDFSQLRVKAKMAHLDLVKARTNRFLLAMRIRARIEMLLPITTE